MMAFFSSRLTPATKARGRALETLDRAKSVHEFLGDVVEVAKGKDVVQSIAKASPWLEAIGVSVAEAVAPVRFAVKLFAEITKIDDPAELGYLACTLAYQQAVQQALPEVAGTKKLKKKKRSQLRDATAKDSYDFSLFSFANALQHEFVSDLDDVLVRSAKELGLDDADTLELQHQVRVRFVPNLKILLSHGKTYQRFEPFARLMALDHHEARAHDALLRHADHQRWLFEEQPVLSVEPFALQHIYVETDCGKLRWSEIDRKREGGPVDPFDEKHGGRQPLVGTVLDLLGDPEFKEAIVLQGPAGSGKTSFTLRLCRALVDQGLRPIRIELKHLDTSESTPIDEALPAAVELSDLERDPDAERFFREDLFLDGRIFEEHVLFHGTKICPYVLILDGWDEISVTASMDYQKQLENLLFRLRQAYLERRNVPVRVILSGRPTDAVARSGFLRRDTAVLTVRPLSSDQLTGLVEVIRRVLDERPLGGEARWSLEDVEGLDQLLKAKKGLDVLELPLLAFLALRLMAEWPGELEELLKSTTTLYRSLVDLVITKAGKPVEADFDPTGRSFLTGDNLRSLLRGTAEAMTVLGVENVGRDELAVRLDLDHTDLDEEIRSLGEEQVLSRLMISFFFRSGHPEHGCEFTHKSFREYLFAEQVVEVLKDYGREAPAELPERPEEFYWKDFEESDPRYDLSRRLAELLGPQWITKEIGRHLDELIHWEIIRAEGNDKPVFGQPTNACSVSMWECIRDALADLWDWWGEGVHLRPQPRRLRRSRRIEHDLPLALEVVLAKGLRSRPDEVQPPVRIVTVDSHLGDALFRLACGAHRDLAYLLKFHKDRSKWQRGSRSRRYQVEYSGDKERRIVAFSPSGPNPTYFRNYVARINAAGNRPWQFGFPTALNLDMVDLRDAWFVNLDFYQATFLRADLRAAHLETADLREANFSGANIFGADLTDANLSRADLTRADLTRADLTDVNLTGADLTGANLTGANLTRVNFSAADLTDANLTGVDRSAVDLSVAHNVPPPDDDPEDQRTDKGTQHE